MKRFFIAVCIIAAFCFSGCGKKKDSSKELAENVAQNKVIPIYQAEEDKFFDFDENEVQDFAFVDDEGEAADNLVVENKEEKFDDEWDEDELTLAWEDEIEQDEEFKVVNFDLNRNEIRDDQRPVVAQNVKVAKDVVESGKDIVVAGHCCQLGPPSFNMSLSEKRAKTIRDEMVKGGVPEGKVKIIGCGSECPVVLSDNSDKEEKIKELAPNRRADISSS